MWGPTGWGDAPRVGKSWPEVRRSLDLWPFRRVQRLDILSGSMSEGLHARLPGGFGGNAAVVPGLTLIESPPGLRARRHPIANEPKDGLDRLEDMRGGALRSSPHPRAPRFRTPSRRPRHLFAVARSSLCRRCRVPSPALRILSAQPSATGSGRTCTSVRLVGSLVRAAPARDPRGRVTFEASSTPSVRRAPRSRSESPGEGAPT